jgi:hypothetical protein
MVSNVHGCHALTVREVASASVGLCRDCRGIDKVAEMQAHCANAPPSSIRFAHRSQADQIKSTIGAVLGYTVAIHIFHLVVCVGMWHVCFQKHTMRNLGA